jgi:hypothetical protein
MAAEDHALVIGIGRYPQLTALAGPVPDAKAFHKWLVSPKGGDVPKKQARLVVSPTGPAADPMTAPPTLSDIQADLDRLQQRGIDNDGVAGRRLWLYLAGHGVGPTASDAALLMANAHVQRLYHLPTGPYLNWFRTAAMFEEVVVIADCCRDYIGRLPPFAMPWPDAASPGSDVHYFTAFATKWSRKAREKPIDGGPVRGIFTKALLEGLEQGRGTAKTLTEFVGQRLPELSAANEFQEPVFDWDVDLTLSTTLAPKPCTLSVSFAAEDGAVTVTVLDGTYQPVASFPMTGGPHDVGVEVGLYAVRRSDQPDAAEKRVSVQTERHDVTV